MKTITGKTKAWLFSHSDPEVLNGPAELAISSVGFSSSNMAPHGWVLVGNATVTFECPDEKVLIENKVAALRGELQMVRSNAAIAAGDLEMKIQKLLAISYEAPV